MILSGRRGAILMAAGIVAFGLAPIPAPQFTGYDPAMFPVAIARPAIQPAGYAFAIWGLIYGWLAVHGVTAATASADHPDWQAHRIWVTISVLLGAGWLFIAPFYPILATVVILIKAATAWAAFLIAPTEPDRWLLSAPLAIYAGWLTAACSVSLGVVLAGYGWLSNTWSALLMLGLVLIGAIFLQTRKPRMPVYGATVVWAIIAIVVVNWGDNTTVATVAVVGAAVMAGATTVITLRR